MGRKKSEGDSGGPKTQLAAYIISSSLSEILHQLWKMIPFHIQSFIKQTLWNRRMLKLVSHLCAERGRDLSEDQIVMVPEGYSDLQVL